MRVYPNKFANTLYIPPDLLINAYLNYCSGRGTMHSHLPDTPHTAVTEAAELSETTARIIEFRFEYTEQRCNNKVCKPTVAGILY